MPIHKRDCSGRENSPSNAKDFADRAGAKERQCRVRGEFYNHDWETYNYVTKHLVGYTGYGRKHPPRNTYTKQTRYSEQDFQSYIDKCEDQIRIIDKVLELYS